MNPLRKSLVICVAALAGLAIGFALRGRLNNQQKSGTLSPSSYSPSTKERRGVLKSQQEIATRIGSPLVTKLAQDLRNANGVTRWLYWVDALERAVPDDFPRLLRLAQGNPAAMRLIETRWIETAPRHLFDTLIADAKRGQGLPPYELMHALFDQWPKRDPDAAIAAINGAGNAPGISQWRWTAAYALIDKDIERGFKLLSEWHEDNVGFGTRGIAAVASWTRSNPQHAAEFMIQQHGGYSFRSAAEVVGAEWAKLDPASALNFAAAHPGEMGNTIATAALKEWSTRNVQSASEWLAGADPQALARLAPTFAQTWAKQDATAALAWSDSNLTGTTRSKAIAAVLAGTAEKDVVTAAGLVTSMPPSATRVDGAVAVAQKWFPELSSDQKVNPATVNWLTGLDTQSAKHVLDRVSWDWATSDPRSMAAYLSTTDTDRVPEFSYTLAGREFARRDPRAAIDWAVSLPAGKDVAAGGAAFAEWRSAQPEAAAKWFESLPQDDARRQPFVESVIQSLAFHPQGAEQLAALPPAERALAKGAIEKLSLPDDRRLKLLEALKITSH